MTKKDYALISHAMNTARHNLHVNEIDSPISNHETVSMLFDYASRIIIEVLANQLHSVDERFDSTKFKKACLTERELITLNE